MDVVFGIGLFSAGALFIGGAAVLGHVLLGPVNRAVGHLNAPTRFLLTDFIWLMIQLQLVLGFVMNWIEGATTTAWLFVVIILLCLPIVVLWAASVSVVSRAGITEPLKRAVLILLLVPGTLGIIVAVPVLFVGTLVVSAAAPDTPLDRTLISYVGLAAGATATSACGFILRRLSFWVLTRRAGLVLPESAEKPVETAG